MPEYLSKNDKKIAKLEADIKEQEAAFGKALSDKAHKVQIDIVGTQNKINKLYEKLRELQRQK